MKRIFSIILFICIALFANAFIVDGLCYNINGTSVYVTYQSSESPNYPNLSGDIIIPSTVTYNGTTYSVTSIGSNAFLGCSNLTSVTIGDSVRAVGSYAFKDCVGLTSVIIGNSVTSIGYEAFEKCTNLTKVDVRDIAAWCNIDFIGGSHSNPLFFAKNLYLNGTIVSNLIIPNSVNTIKELVFNGCTCITSVTIPNSVTSIGSYAFLGCTGLTSVTIPNSVTVIGGSAFSDCTSLTSVIWNAKACNDCTTNSPFKNLTYIQSFTFGNEVEQIPALLCYGFGGQGFAFFLLTLFPAAMCGVLMMYIRDMSTSDEEIQQSMDNLNSVNYLEALKRRGVELPYYYVKQLEQVNSAGDRTASSAEDAS